MLASGPLLEALIYYVCGWGCWYIVFLHGIKKITIATNSKRIGNNFGEFDFMTFGFGKVLVCFRLAFASVSLWARIVSQR
jgi:hypothetical protein